MSMLQPEWHNGMQRWVAPEVAEIMDKLQNGDPALGWEGDPFLDMYHDGDCWYLCRHEHGTVEPIIRSRPGMKLDHRLIEFLVTHDAQRGYNVVDDVLRQNEQWERSRMQAADEAISEVSDRLAFNLRKDFGQRF